MTTATTNITIRIDKNLKNDAEALFDDLGMSISTAFNIFLKKCIREDRIPFEVSRTDNFSQTTLNAILEAERISHDPNLKGYHDIDQMFKDILAEQDDEDAN